MAEEKDTRPKFKLRAGLRATNVEVYEKDGSRHTERVEPGKVYVGEKYLRWVPSIFTPTSETLKAGLPPTPEPPVRRGRRRLRPGIAAVTEAVRSGAVAMPTATLTKKDPSEMKSKVDEEAERGKPPVEPEGKTPEQEAAEKKAPEPPREPEEPTDAPTEPPESDDGDEDEEYEEPEITSRTDLRKMKKNDLLKLALFHDYDVSDEDGRDTLLETLFAHYEL